MSSSNWKAGIAIPEIFLLSEEPFAREDMPALALDPIIVVPQQMTGLPESVQQTIKDTAGK